MGWGGCGQGRDDRLDDATYHRGQERRCCCGPTARSRVGDPDGRRRWPLESGPFGVGGGRWGWLADHVGTCGCVEGTVIRRTWIGTVVVDEDELSFFDFGWAIAAYVKGARFVWATSLVEGAGWEPGMGWGPGACWSNGLAWMGWRDDVVDGGIAGVDVGYSWRDGSDDPDGPDGTDADGTMGRGFGWWGAKENGARSAW